MRSLNDLCEHKWYVLIFGIRLGAPLLRLLRHDMSDLLRKHAADRAMARLHHYHTHDHHWQYWVLLDDDGGRTALEMPVAAVREMTADWMSAARMHGRDARFWYAERRELLTLHPATRALVETLLGRGL